jgi:hypothetical protein
MQELDDLLPCARVLDKLLGAASLQKAALAAMVAQLVDIDKRLTKLEAREHWPAFYEAVSLAPGTVIHSAPEMVQ